VSIVLHASYVNM